MTEFTLSQDTIEWLSPCALGEIMRDLLFDQQGGKRMGCYDTFDVRDGWDPLPLSETMALMRAAYTEISKDRAWEDVDWECWLDDWEKATGYSKWFGERVIQAAWFWDGDGTLAFRVSPTRVIVNTDCKKDYEWGDAL